MNGGMTAVHLDWHPGKVVKKEVCCSSLVQVLLFRGDFSQVKLRFAIYKGMVQHRLRKNGYGKLADGFEAVTDGVFRMLR